MIMGTAQKQNIASQHRYFKTHGGQIRAQNPVSFEKWFLVCLRKCEKKGVEFTFLCPGLVRISWPDKIPMLRTLQDFKRGMRENIFQTSNLHFSKNRYVALRIKDKGEKMTKVTDFAEACHNQNSRSGLKKALEGKADETDMKIWDITEDQWREALEVAVIAIEKDLSVDEAMKLTR